MTNTSANPIAVNGVRLDTLAYNISTKSGVVHMAAIRGVSDVIPGKNGSMYSPGKRREEGRIILSMWANDTDVDGNFLSSDRYANWRKNMDMLLMLFDTSLAQVTVTEQVSTTEQRMAICEVRASIDPEVLGRVYGEFKVELIINDTFWMANADSEFVSPTGTTAVALHSLSPFAGATAPMEDLIAIVDGPLTNPSLTDIRSGHLCRYNGALPAGQQWQVNTTTWRSVTGAGLEYSTTGGTSVTAQTVAYGLHAPRLFALSADAPPKVRLDGTAAAATTRFRLKGRKKFH